MTGAIDAGMLDMGKKARLAADFLALAPRAIKDHALMLAAQNIRAHASEILSANELDQAAAHKRGLSGAMVERLILNPARLESIAHGLEVVAQLPDPVGVVTDHWVQPNGLDFSRVRVPLGVVGIIFESRPNVTIDAGALCLKSGNAAILRGGSDALRTSTALAAQLAAGIIEAGLPDHCVQLVASEDRAAVGAMLSGLNGAIDVIVPRGGKGLVARVQEDARVPVLAHLDGNCHVYIHRAADPEKAMAITLNAKLRRTGVCGSAETVLFDTGFDARPIIRALLDQGCAVRGDNAIQALDSRVQPVAVADWDTEFLDAIIAAGVVSSLDDAIGHIGRHGSHHTDAIITEDQSAADQFLRRVDSAIVLHNASTQFADGAEFGFGAEIGIATGRLHARGPVGLEQLTTFKYCVRGQGHIRP